MEYGMNFEEYLKLKHLEDCNRLGRILTESEWVKDVLNTKLPEGGGLAYVSVNQWMNGGRSPEAKNIVRLIKVFGPEVMPYVGIYLPADLSRLVRDWDKLNEDDKQQIMAIANLDKEMETVK